MQNNLKKLTKRTIHIRDLRLAMLYIKLANLKPHKYQFDGAGVIIISLPIHDSPFVDSQLPHEEFDMAYKLDLLETTLSGSGSLVIF